jgi:sirohydrochlorin ferrochelatase
MEAIILLGHGSRAAGAARDMERVAEALKRTLGVSLVAPAHMSLAKPGLEEVFAQVLAAGATRVLVMPYFLHLGMHMRADIPRMLQELCAAHPRVQVVLGKHLGFDEALVGLVAKRIRESRDLPDVRTVKVADEPGGGAHRHGSSHSRTGALRSERRP